MMRALLGLVLVLAGAALFVSAAPALVGARRPAPPAPPAEPPTGDPSSGPPA